MNPATYNFPVVRGSAGPTSGIVFKLQTQDGDDPPVNIPYDNIRLSIYNSTTLLLRATLDGGGIQVVDVLTNQFAWVPTATETRLIPSGEVARYELEVWNGTSELVYLIGTIKGVGGLNDDIP